MKLVSLYDGIRQAKNDRKYRNIFQGVRAIDNNVIMLEINGQIVVWHKVTPTKAERFIFQTGESYIYGEKANWDQIFEALLD